MKLMRYVGLGVLSAMVVTAAHAPANAADMYRGTPAPSLKDTYVPVSSWTGLYLGANVGATWPNNEQIVFEDDAKLIGGAHGGYNFQRGNWVFGIEGDVNFADDIEYLATARGRLGYAFDRTLFYGTGGAAFVGFDNADFKDETGWVAGGGIEHKIRPNLSIGAEALYYSFDDVGYGADDSLEMWTARARLTYHFGGDREGLK